MTGQFLGSAEAEKWARKNYFSPIRIDQQICTRFVEQAIGNPHQPEFASASNGNSFSLHEFLMVS